MNILGGIIGVVIGFLVIKYSIQITQMLGTIEFAERYLRGGMAGTITFYRLAGVIVIILSFLYMFGGIGVIVAPLRNIFGG